MLSQPERDRFADWCEQDASAILGLVEQMAKLPNMEAIMKVKRTEAMAQQVVAKMLRSTEDF
jgi:hypothetical protein